MRHLKLITKSPSVFAWLVLYIPFGAFSGFVNIALTFEATRHGLTPAQGSFLIGAQLFVSWLKWSWAPAVDLIKSSKAVYLVSTLLLALATLALSSLSLGPSTLPVLLLVIALASVINSVVGMAVEKMIAELADETHIGQASAWLQAGGLGGAGLGGALGLYLLEKLPSPWMTGLILGGVYLACCPALYLLPNTLVQTVWERRQTVAGVFRELWSVLWKREGRLTAILCLLPIATGAAQGILTQASVAAHWGASAMEVGLVQGLLSGLATATGCFVGGWFCDHYQPRTVYAGFGLVVAGVAAAMAMSPTTSSNYVFFNIVYAVAMGLSYAAFSAMTLNAIGHKVAATGYNTFSSLANFPIWWTGLLLGWVAEKFGSLSVLWCESLLGVAGVIIFCLVCARKPQSHSSGTTVRPQVMLRPRPTASIGMLIK